MSRSLLQRNIIANFAGKAWISVMGLAFIPLYIKFMGIESYGLIGIFVSLSALISLLDLGLSSTLSRQLAILSISPDNAQESRDLVRTLETLFWAAGCIISVVVAALAPLVAHYWITSQAIPRNTVQQALTIMGLVIAVQWPSSLYDGGLVGMQRQELLNGIRSIMATFQHAGAVLILWLVSPTILAYFTWQIFTNLVQTTLLAYAVRTSLPSAPLPGSFRAALLKKNWKFAAGMTGISVLSIVLMQTDKIILSRLLPLTVFGYYMLAFNLASVLTYFMSPFFLSFYPRFSQLVADHAGIVAIADLYHKSCQLVSAAIFPVAGIIIFYAREILLLWTRDTVIVANTSALLSIMTIGSLFNAVMILPFTLQLAHGWTKLSFYKNIIAVIVLIPLMIAMTIKFGAMGAAIVWIILNMGYFFLEVPVMHSRLLKHEMWQWYKRDAGVPFVLAMCLSALSHTLMPHTSSPYFLAMWILLSGSVAFTMTALSMPHISSWLKKGMIP